MNGPLVVKVRAQPADDVRHARGSYSGEMVIQRDRCRRTREPNMIGN
jgi:hypothetical protein